MHEPEGLSPTPITFSIVPLTTRGFASTAVVLLAFAGFGCSDQLLPPESSHDAIEMGSSQASSSERRARPDEAHLEIFAERIPGFGGFAFDRAGNLMVYLTDLEHSDLADKLLSPLLAMRRDYKRPGHEPRGHRQVLIYQGEYTFQQLANWRDAITGNLLGQVEGLITNGVSERHNRLLVGIEAGTPGALVEAIVSEIEMLSVPREAVILIELDPPVLESGSSSTTLRDSVRPLVGGLQLQFAPSSEDFDIGNVCTVGPIVTFNNRRGFLTAAHCSRWVWNLDDTRYYQPLISQAALAGQEYSDPPPERCGWFTSRRCRWSDVSFVQISADVESKRGLIARPDSMGGPHRPAEGSVTIDPLNPTFEIIAKKTDGMTQGLDVDMVGRSSGWTWGYIEESCQDMWLIEERNWMVECQHWADYGSRDGDSGAPVFHIHSFQPPEVEIYGIHMMSITGPDIPAGGYAVYSSFKGAELDYGAEMGVTVPYSGGGDPSDPCEPEPDQLECDP